MSDSTWTSELSRKWTSTNRTIPIVVYTNRIISWGNSQGKELWRQAMCSPLVPKSRGPTTSSTPPRLSAAASTLARIRRITSNSLSLNKGLFIINQWETASATRKDTIRKKEIVCLEKATRKAPIPSVVELSSRTAPRQCARSTLDQSLLWSTRSSTRTLRLS